MIAHLGKVRLSARARCAIRLLSGAGIGMEIRVFCLFRGCADRVGDKRVRCSGFVRWDRCIIVWSVIWECFCGLEMCGVL